MKIYERIVMDWDGNVLEEQGFEYEGPVALCGGGGKGSTPSPPPAPPLARGAPAPANPALPAVHAAPQPTALPQGLRAAPASAADAPRFSSTWIRRR